MGDEFSWFDDILLYVPGVHIHITGTNAQSIWGIVTTMWWYPLKIVILMSQMLILDSWYPQMWWYLISPQLWGYPQLWAPHC